MRKIEEISIRGKILSKGLILETEAQALLGEAFDQLYFQMQ